METESKSKSITMARELQEAMVTLDVALMPGAEDLEIVEAKNIVANVLRDYKAFLSSLTGRERDEAMDLFSARIEALAHKAKRLR